MDNKFLRDFIKMRQEIVKSAIPTTTPTTRARGGAGASSLSTMPVPTSDLTLAYIISKKPPRKEVIEYFTGRINELVEEAGDM